MAAPLTTIGPPGGGGSSQHSGSVPTGTPYYWYLTGGDPTGGGYYGTGGGMGYIHGTPQDDINAWQLYTEMRRNGWNPYSPFGIEEARRGMGQFTNEQWNDYLLQQMEQQRRQDPQGGAGKPEFEVSGAENLLKKILFENKIAKFLGFGKWLKNQDDKWSINDWIESLTDPQRQWIDNWMVGQGADKNWADRLRAGDAPWSNSDTAINQTARQNPDAPTGIEHPEPPPGPGGLGKGKKNEPGGGGEGEGNWTPPPYQALYQQSNTFQPYFLDWQPTNTGGPIQFVKG